MLDLKQIRQDKEKIEELLKRKDPEITLAPIVALDEEVRKLKTKGEELKHKLKTASKEIGNLKREGKDASKAMEAVASLGDEIKKIDKEISNKEGELKYLLSSLPNIPDESIPISPNPEDNVCIKEVGKKPAFDFPFKNHLELNERLDLFDFPRGAKITGSGWPVYRNIGARLEWALVQFMLNKQIQNGFTPFIPPFVVQRETIFSSGQLPKFENQQFKITDDQFDHFLIPTAEVSLNGLHLDEIIEEEKLPFKYCAYTPCFRREAGAAGAQERGLIRVHQFNKVELFCFSKPEESWKIFDEMMAAAESVLQDLELHYRNMLLVTGDTSFGSAKTIDIECWLPGQNRYYEVSSVSNCTDFQSRRSMTRCKNQGEKPRLVHTLNGSGLATPRLMVAILENNQQKDGSVVIPKVLRPYLDGKEILEPKASA